MAEKLAPVVGVHRPVGDERVGRAGTGRCGALDRQRGFVPIAGRYRGAVLALDTRQPLQTLTTQVFGKELIHFVWVFGVVGRLDLRMLDEHKQAIEVIDQFLLQPDERRLGVGRLVFNDGFAVAGAKRTDIILQFMCLGPRAPRSGGDPCGSGRLALLTFFFIDSPGHLIGTYAESNKDKSLKSVLHGEVQGPIVACRARCDFLK